MSLYDTEITTAEGAVRRHGETMPVRAQDGVLSVILDIDIVGDEDTITDAVVIDDPVSLLALADACLSAAAHTLSSDNRLNLHPLSTIDPDRLDAERHRLRSAAARVELVGSEWSRVSRLVPEAYALHVEIRSAVDDHVRGRS